MSDKTSPGILRSFPPVFWVANVMELFERGAYYGMNSVLAIYLSDSVASGGLGFSEKSIGFLQGLITLPYVVRSWAARSPTGTATAAC
jgi:dipeptide/tripeptide permease